MSTLIAQRNTVILTFIAFGAAAGSQFGALPFLVKRLEITPLAFGMLGAGGMLSGILAWAICGKLAHRLENRQMLLAILPIAFIALVLLLLAPNFWSFVAAFCLFSFSLGFMDLFMNAEGAVVEHDLKVAVFSRYHGSASLAISLFAILGSIISVVATPIAVVALTAIPFVVAWAAVHKHVPHRIIANDQTGAAKVKLPIKLLAIVGLAAGFGVSCEMAALQWAGQLLVSIAPQLAAFSGLGVAFYGFCNGTVRLMGDWLRARFGDLRTVVSGICIGIVGFVILAFAPGFWLSTLAFALVGFGFAVLFPTLYSFTAKSVPEARAAAMGYVTAVSGVPRSITPWVLGWLASAFSLSVVFAAAAVVAAVALLLVVLALAGKQEKKILAN
jgi:MFS family permease